jgi:hypothetical protein
VSKKPTEKVMATPDLQMPFHHRDSLDFLQAVIKKEKPSLHVNMGDEVDFHALGNWDHDPDGFSAGHELKAAQEALLDLYMVIPNTMVCTSNHTARPFRKAYKHGIPKEFIRDYSEFLKAPKGWNWSDSFEVDGVIYEHGEGYSGQQGALKAALANMQSTCIGHLHSYAGIQWSANSRHLIFGFNTGCLIDRHAYAFAYGKHQPQKPILGCGIIDRAIPKFIPMLLDKNGRWTGKL